MEARVANANMEVTWDAQARVAFVTYLPGAKLGRADGELLAQALETWVREPAPFGFLVNAAELVSIDSDYRARMSTFANAHRKYCFIALIDVGPVIHIVAEMFRMATRIQVKTFTSEAAGRMWLRAKGVPA